MYVYIEIECCILLNRYDWYLLKNKSKIFYCYIKSYDNLY